MSEGGPFLFDIGVVALAHADTPVSDTPLSYVQRAIRGEIDAVVPYPVAFGAQIVLTAVTARKPTALAVGRSA